MKSRSAIEMDFNLAKSKANELENIANSVSNVSGNLSSTLEGVPNVWSATGSSTMYVQKGNEIAGQIQTSANNIQRTADTIRTIAQNVYNAEMEAVRIAEEREAQARAEEARRLAEQQAAAAAAAQKNSTTKR